MSRRNSEQTNNANHMLRYFLFNVSQNAKTARRVEQLKQLSHDSLDSLSSLIDSHDEDFSRGQDQWPDGLVHNLAQLAVKGHYAEVEANELRQPPFLYDRGMKILERIPNWAGIMIVADSISGDPIFKGRTYRNRSGPYNYYTIDKPLATAQGILRSDSILDIDDTTLLLRTTENVFRRRRFMVPLIDPVSLEPQVTLRVAES